MTNHHALGTRQLFKSVLVGAIVLVFSLEARSESGPSIQTLRGKVLQANNYTARYAALKALFQRLSATELKELMNDDDVGIALQAAWEVHKKPIKRRTPVPRREEKVFDPDELAKFLAFLKDRTKAPVPEWWAKLIVDVDLCIERFQKFPAIDPDNGGIGPKVHKSKLGNLVPEGFELEKHGDKLSLTKGGRSVELSEESAKGDRAIAATFTEKLAILACYPDTATGYTMRALNSKSTGEAWKADIWSLVSGDFPGSGPPGYHRVEVKVLDNVIFVFGGDLWGLYVESLEADTGKSRFRFSTSYWGDHSRLFDDK